MQPSEQVIVPPDTVRDDDRASCGRVNRNVQALAGQVLAALPQPIRISATLEAARQAVARLPVANSIRAAVYRTVQTTVVNDTLKEQR